MKSGVIFDLDGTLVDSLPGIAASLNRTLTAHGLPGQSHANVRRFIGDGLRTLIRRAAPVGSTQEQLDSMLRYYMPDYAATWRDGTQLFPGIAAALAELSREGTPLAILSNKTHDFTVEMVRELLPSAHFTAVLGLREGMPPKPDPRGALEIAARLDLPPSSCFFVGDSTMDIEVAANAEMNALAVTWGYHDRTLLEAAGATTFVETVSDLVPALRDLHENQSTAR